MSQEKSSGCMKAFMIFCLLNVLLLAAICAGVYVVWKKNGSPSLEAIQAMAGERQGMQFGGGAAEEESASEGSSSSSRSANRPIIATSPIQGNATTYKAYTARKDVMTLVNYYSDT